MALAAVPGLRRGMRHCGLRRRIGVTPDAHPAARGTQQMLSSGCSLMWRMALQTLGLTGVRMMACGSIKIRMTAGAQLLRPRFKQVRFISGMRNMAGPTVAFNHRGMAVVRLRLLPHRCMAAQTQLILRCLQLRRPGLMALLTAARSNRCMHGAPPQHR